MAARNIGSLTIDLIMRTVGLTQGADKAERELDKRAKRIQQSATRIGKAIGTAVGVAATAAVTGLAVSLKTSIDRMDELSKAAQRAQLPTEQFSQLAYAAELADVEMSDLVTAMGRLARAQDEAASGTKTQIEAFKRLGIEFQNGDKTLRDSREVFLDFADAYQKFRGSPEVLAAGMDIFGRSFQNLIPLLKDGREGLEAAAAESDALGRTLTTEAGVAAEQFNDNLTRLKGAMGGLSQQIAGQLLDDLNDTTDALVRITKEGDLARNMVSLISGAMQAGIWIIQKYNEEVFRLSIGFETAEKSLGGLFTIMQGGLNNPASLVSGFAQIRSAMESEEQQIAQYLRNRNLPNFSNVRTGPDFSNVTTGPVPARPPPIVDPESTKKIKDRSSAVKELTEAEKAWLQLEEEIAAHEELAGEAYRDAALDRIRAAQDEADAKERNRKDDAAYLDDLQREIDLIGMSNVQRERAIALSYLSKDATDAEREAVARLSDEREKALEAARYWEDVERSLSDSLYDFATGARNAKEALGDFLDALFSQSVQAAADYFSEAITGMFKNAGNNDGGNGGGWGELFSAIGGFFGGGKANGGYAPPYMLHEVNERGLEMATVGGRDYLLTGGKGAQITPAGQWGMGGMNISMVNNFDRNNSQATPDQIAVRTGQRIQRELARTGR